MWWSRVSQLHILCILDELGSTGRVDLLLKRVTTVRDPLLEADMMCGCLRCCAQYVEALQLSARNWIEHMSCNFFSREVPHP